PVGRRVRVALEAVSWTRDRAFKEEGPEMSQRSNQPDPLDPFGAWRGMRDANMDTWSKMMIDFVNSDVYTEATSKALDAYLTASAPFQRMIEATMTRVLTQLNMPTRSDVTGLAERLTNIELRLDDLDARLDALQSSSTPQPAASNAPASKPKDRSS